VIRRNSPSSFVRSVSFRIACLAFFDSMSRHPHLGRSLPSAILSAVTLTAIFGCGGQPRSSVSGKVTFDDQPVAAGQIVFEPQGAGRVGIAQISEGAYSMPAGQGPTVGKYVVRITANRPTGRKATAGRGSDNKTRVDQYEQFIPVKYNDQSELTTEVGGEGQIVRDFRLTSK
jgi:hypothetical protein